LRSPTPNRFVTGVRDTTVTDVGADHYCVSINPHAISAVVRFVRVATGA
jgi:hypothetical protein